MKLEVPDDIARRAEACVLELQIALAVQLYSDNRIDHRDACRLAGVSEAVFNRELLTRHISLQQYPAGRTAARAAG
jgi:predicted HTH domain antitoxin